MANRIRSFIESLVYAGLKPSGGVPAETAQRPRRLGPLRDKIERFLSRGPAPADPLYLTNRTWKQRLRLALTIAIPTGLVFGVLALVFNRVYAPKSAPPKEVTAAEILKNLLPDVEKTVKINAYTDSEIVELRVLRNGPPRIVGALRNKTDRVISVEFDLAFSDQQGSRVGSATERVDNAPPNATVPFEFPVSSSEAVYAIVRKMRTAR
jgi:hypothetical protein